MSVIAFCVLGFILEQFYKSESFLRRFMTHPMDDILIIEQLFYVRKTASQIHRNPNIHDGVVLVDVPDNIHLGYRLYVHRPESPLIVFFHGNGEIAADYDDVAPFYHAVGVSLLVVDYRGYGWSTGYPLTTRLIPDAVEFMKKLPEVKEKHKFNPKKVYVMGRSLGSACSVGIAFLVPDLVYGLIIESGFADSPSVFRRLSLPLPDAVMNDPEMPLNNLGKVKNIKIPTLVIHGEHDEIFPMVHADDLFVYSGASRKQRLIIPRATHNDLMTKNVALYFSAIREFLKGD
jgi:pimeloyl-ACP methyl ester carboxylesterase